MPLNAINISITDDDVSASYVSDILFEMGALSVNMTDLYSGKPTEQPVFAEPPTMLEQSASPPQWKNASITALYPISVNVESLIMIIATHFNLPLTPTFSIQSDVFDEKTPEEWVRHVQSSFQPIELERIRISFPWHEPRSDLIDLRLEPGVAFGTGEHATTQLCTSWLTKVMKSGYKVLDFGTGSGVLAIASVLLADDVSAVGIDIDTMAVSVAHGNAKLNGVESRVEFYENDREPMNRVYDVVVANILARPLKELAEHLVARLKPGGFIALSGLLVSQAPQLVEWYAKFGICLHDAHVKSGWTLLVGIKR